MPYVAIPGNDDRYALVAFDRDGIERTDDPDGIMSHRILQSLSQENFSDVFILSHGWKGDVPSAREQYDAWIAAMMACSVDRERAHQRAGFRPLIIGLHWPSEPWGDEEFSADSATSSTASEQVTEKWLSDHASRIADTAPAREALRTILMAARRNPSPNQLPDDARDAYVVLDREAGVSSQGVGAAPGADREELGPEDRYQIARTDSAVSFGLGGRLENLVLSPLRQLSFWKMKDRARRFGESAAHRLVASLMTAQGGIRLHVMGHSFGCIVASALVAGPIDGTALPNRVSSLVLLQGAMSLWSYCASLRDAAGTPGYFRPLIERQSISGPIVTTRSNFDTAVGRWYPLAAGVARQLDYALAYATDKLPKYGGTGTFGLQGEGLDTVALEIQAPDRRYDFQSGRIFNVECGSVIRNGGGLSGAHSDIAHPEVAHIVWSAALIP
jgi:pimeloyl-ACP methyl ester carboxylesterase